MLFDLEAKHDSHNSFYGKARVLDSMNWIFLYSYETIVCRIDKKDGTFHRMWAGYSATTMRHINEFVLQFNPIGGGTGKKWWESLKLD